MGCFFGHKWNGCKCERCGETRDEGHDWSGCTCRICGKKRDEGHEWQSVEGKCFDVCSICGHKRTKEHLFQGSVCTRCGFDKTMPSVEDWFRKYDGTAETVNIPEGFKIISAGAFSKNANIKKVVLPNTVVEIKREAFCLCGELREVVIPQSVKVIGEQVFYGCNKLGPVWLPSGIRCANDSFDEGHKLTGPGAPNPDDKITPFIEDIASQIQEIEKRASSEGTAYDDCLRILLAIYDPSRQDSDFTNRSEDNKLIRRIGSYLDQKGGMHAMRTVGEKFARQNPARARLLETTWDGIGMWQG